jgi:hypothetical protein
MNERGCASVRSDPPEVTVKISLKLKRCLRELRTTTYVTTTEKLIVTIDKGQKPGNFVKLKNPSAHTSEAWKRGYVRETPDVW